LINIRAAEACTAICHRPSLLKLFRVRVVNKLRIADAPRGACRGWQKHRDLLLGDL